MDRGALIFILFLLWGSWAGADTCAEALEQVHEQCGAHRPDEAFDEADTAAPKNFQLVLNSSRACADKVGTCYKECGNKSLGSGASVEALVRKLRNSYGDPPLRGEVVQCRDAFKVYADSYYANCDGHFIGQRLVTESALLGFQQVAKQCDLLSKMEIATALIEEPDKGRDETDKAPDKAPKFVDVEFGKASRPLAEKSPSKPAPDLAKDLRPDLRVAPTNGSFQNTGGIDGLSSEPSKSGSAVPSMQGRIRNHQATQAVRGSGNVTNIRGDTSSGASVLAPPALGTKGGAEIPVVHPSRDVASEEIHSIWDITHDTVERLRRSGGLLE